WHMLPQVRVPRQVTREGLSDGALLISWGLFKKMYIADNLAEIVTSVFEGPGPLDGLSALMAVYAFAFQIYCDFSGYTDVARGLGRILGFNLFANFHLPYFALNPTEFWRRWHISLSAWLRDYLYIPLGGNRGGTARTHVNLMITMLLGGLWHGAAWTFVLWGGYHGALLVVHRLCRPVLDVMFAARTGIAEAVSRGVRVLATFHLVCFGWLIFRADSLAEAGGILSAIGNGVSWTPRGSYYLSRLVLLVAFLLIVQLVQAWRDDLLVLQQVRSPWARASLYLYMYCSIWFLGNLGGHEFIYFQF
ncbi:MAG: MBOAT family O-acyltransferase, partial [Deltaproteobacteria bacterium]|nr:MBOAT family O-acyltransferase [Deltaproteobacteria bacterium]